MNVELDRLARLMPPPAVEVAVPPWELSRSEIGFDFPEDYRQFADLYGAGEITPSEEGAQLSVRVPHREVCRPGAPGGFKGFLEIHDTQVRPAFVFEGADEEYWGGTVYPLYPDEGGLLSWGASDDGDVLFWKTGDPDPNRWPVVMWARHPGVSYPFDGGMVAFLLAVVGGEHVASEWLGGPGSSWTMHSDWLHTGLRISARPAASED